MNEAMSLNIKKESSLPLGMTTKTICQLDPFSCAQVTPREIFRKMTEAFTGLGTPRTRAILELT